MPVWLRPLSVAASQTKPFRRAYWLTTTSAIGEDYVNARRIARHGSTAAPGDHAHRAADRVGLVLSLVLGVDGTDTIAAVPLLERRCADEVEAHYRGG